MISEGGREKGWRLVGTTIAAHDDLALAYVHKGDKTAGANVHYRLGILFNRIAWSNYALTEFKKGMAVDPEPSAETYSMLGIIYGKLGKYSEAQRAFQKGLEIGPDSAVYCNLGRLYITQGYGSEAIRSFKNAIKFDSTCTEARHNLAVLCYNAGDYKQALEHWKNIRKIDHNYPNLDKNISLAQSKLQYIVDY